MVLVVFAKPEHERSYGMHEPLGSSKVKVDQYAMSGVVYTKQKYLDPHDYDEQYFNFRCTEINGVTGPPNITAHPELVGTDWYAICGTPFDNRAEYIVVIWSFCIIAMFAFYNALARSSPPSEITSKAITNFMKTTAGSGEPNMSSKNKKKSKRKTKIN